MSERSAPIMFVTRKWAPATGGMETYCLRLTEALDEHGEVQVIALPGHANGMPPGLLALLFFPFTFLAASLQRVNNPHVLHLADMAIWPLGLVAWLWPETRLILSAHGTDVAFHRRGGITGTLYGAYLRLGARLLNRRATIIANSHATRAVTQETGWQHIEIVPLASDLPAPQTATSGSRTILFAGRLVRRKGCAWFIENALPLLPQDITLDVAGTAWDESERAALDNPRVRFLGSVDQRELAQRYANALCVVVPNIDAGNGEYEGFGLVAPEAAAAGGVVLAANHGGLTDAVLDGETGLLLPSGDAAAWASAIERVANWSDAERRDFTETATNRAREQFSWQRVARETYAAYVESDSSPAPAPAQSPSSTGSFKKLLLVLAVLLFISGSVWSFVSLSLDVSDLDFLALLALTVPMGLVLVAYSALSLMVLARIAQVRMSFVQGMRTSVHAQMAEALPIPGGAIVRSAALISAGCSVSRGAALIISSAMMWIALACLAAGLFMLTAVPAAAWPLLLGGGAVSLGAFAYLTAVGGWLSAWLALLLRILGLALASVRLWLAFAVLKAILPLSATFPYVLAAIAGSASSIAPGGLGISEALGALMAETLGSAPQIAFLAVAINRISQFLGTALLAPFVELKFHSTSKVAVHD